MHLLGSKTAQILESIHGNDIASVPSGMVVANDADEKRAYMLVISFSHLPSSLIYPLSLWLSSLSPTPWIVPVNYVSH
jgi:hypothetical protein